MTIKNAQDVLDFWFAYENKDKLFASDPDFDQEIRSQFAATWKAACRGELASWRETAQGRLAEIIVLDQFSRNLNRGDVKAYSQDGMALVLAQEALKADGFSQMDPAYQRFALMPFMHSESAAIHQEALQLFEDLGHPSSLKYEKQHKAIIDRFGYYPHRKKDLGLPLSQEEKDFLQEENSSF